VPMLRCYAVPTYGKHIILTTDVE